MAFWYNFTYIEVPPTLSSLIRNDACHNTLFWCILQRWQRKCTYPAKGNSTCNLVGLFWMDVRWGWPMNQQPGESCLPLVKDTGTTSTSISQLGIHPASRGVAAHTASLFRSVRGAKGGFPPWGLPKLRIFTFPPPAKADIVRLLY